MQTEERSAWERLRTDEEREHFIAHPGSVAILLPNQRE